MEKCKTCKKKCPSFEECVLCMELEGSRLEAELKALKEKGA